MENCYVMEWMDNLLICKINMVVEVEELFKYLLNILKGMDSSKLKEGIQINPIK